MWNYKPTENTRKNATAKPVVSSFDGNTALSNYMNGMQQLYSLPNAVANQWVEMVRNVNSPASNQTKGLEDKKSQDEKVKLNSPFVGGVSPQDMVKLFSKVGGQVICKPSVVLEETNKLAKELSAAVANPNALEVKRGPSFP